MTWYLHTTCVQCSGVEVDLLNRMTRVARRINYPAIRRNLGEALVDLERSLGYATNHRKGLHMKNDFAVSFWRSRWDGRLTYYVRWSAIEHIFLEVP